MACFRVNFLLLGMSSRLRVVRLFHIVLRTLQTFVRCRKIWGNFVYMRATCNSLDRMKTDLVNFVRSISVPEPDRSSPYPTFHFLKIHLNIILPSTPGAPKWSLSFRFLHQNLLSSPHTRYMLHPPHSSRFDHPNNIG